MVYIVTSNKIQDSNEKWYLNLENKNLHNSLKFFVLILQVLGLLPVKNVLKSYGELKFSWRSSIVSYSLLLIGLASFAVFACIYTWIDYGYRFSDLGTFAFFFESVATLLLYMRLATRWSILMKSWCKMDKIMNKNYGYPPNLDKRLRICTTVFLSLAFTEFFLSNYNRYNNMVIKFGDKYEYRHMFNETFHQLYLILPINWFTAAYCMFVSLQTTLVQACNDLFIILMSIVLALRFKQITQKLEENFSKFQVKSPEYWIGVREDYDRLCKLCKELDDNISYLVLLSYSFNLFFLLIQLYRSLEVGAHKLGQVYFIYTFIYNISKIVGVSIYGAWINDESIGPATILNSVSSACYNIEVRRILMQIGFDNIALTGCRMFKITRGIILSIAGAVVTYELVLIQFNVATETRN